MTNDHLARRARTGARTLVVALAGTLLAGTAIAETNPPEPDVQEQLFKLQKDSALVLDKLAALEQSLGGQNTSQNACAEAAARTENLERKMRVLEEQFLATQKRLDDIVTELRAQRRGGTAPAPALPATGTAPDAAPPGAPSAAPVAPPATAPPTTGTPAPAPTASKAAVAAPGSVLGAPEDLFNGAYADYSRGNYDLALAGFESALRADPQGPLADDAQFWIGESLYAKGRFPEAAAAFDKVITGWPAGDKLAVAHLKRGFALYEARRTADGVAELQRVIQTWPTSDEARLAKEFLKKRGAL